MAKVTEIYDYITEKINNLKAQYPSLRSQTDDYVFSALCIKANFYKSPALILNGSDFEEMIVDSPNDGGADILLSDPNSETSDLIIGQSKLYRTITAEQVLNAVRKMADFYKDMTAGHYEIVNAKVQSRFRRLHAELGDESKIHFVFYTSAPKNRIDIKRIKKKFCEQFTDLNAIEVDIFFAADIEDEIKESLLRKPAVEYGKIRINEANNYLAYGDDAVIVNVSAFSIKELYAEHNIDLLSQNLRYHIKGKAAGIDIDGAIRNTIDNNPVSFWLKNNGITIICDRFEIDGNIVKLWNFSIVNGGQTTYQIHRNENIDAQNFFWLPCKIIKNIGKTEDEKNAFSLEIAQAANSQKPIQPADLKANSPEQRRFVQAMKNVGILYKTKRGEDVPKKYNKPYLNTNLAEVGKLCLAAIFQEPCKSRNNPSASYNDLKYYNPIFNGNQEQIVAICKELLYIDKYFDTFIKKFERNNKGFPIISFARLSRRLCVAFVALVARYHRGNITDENVLGLISVQSDSNVLYKTFRELGDMKSLLPLKLYTDAYDEALSILFEIIIDKGSTAYFYERKRTPDLTETNFMKNDKYYYEILADNWSTLKKKINEIFSDV